MRKLTLFFFLFGFSLHSNAGVIATTAHSRANCGNNESITWRLGYSYNWRVFSVHWNKMHKTVHHIDTGWSTTWRQAAVHWGEAKMCSKEWFVDGYHYWEGWARGRIPFEHTAVNDCSIYDGWWDH